jgi:hypothetical protein
MERDERMKIKQLEQTCCSFPSQWEAVTPDGREVYIRYRQNHLTAWLAESAEEEALDGKLIVDLILAKNMQNDEGGLDESRMLALTNLKVVP